MAVIIELSAIYHRPDSEYAYLYESDLMHIRLRTKKDDVKEVFLISGDPYSYDQEKWYLREKPLKKLFSILYHDYWMIEVTAPFNRLAYGFHIIGNDGQEIFYGDKGFFHYEKDLLGRTGRPTLVDEAPSATAVRVEMRDPDYSAEMPGRLAKLETAISKQRTVKFAYRAMTSGKETERTLNPYGLLNDRGDAVFPLYFQWAVSSELRSRLQTTG